MSTTGNLPANYDEEPPDTSTAAPSYEKSHAPESKPLSNESARGKGGAIPHLYIPSDRQHNIDAPPQSTKHDVEATNATDAVEPRDQPRKLPADKLIALAVSPDALPVHLQDNDESYSPRAPVQPLSEPVEHDQWQTVNRKGHGRKRSDSMQQLLSAHTEKLIRSPLAPVTGALNAQERPPLSARTVSTPLLKSRTSSASKHYDKLQVPNGEGKPLKPSPSALDVKDGRKDSARQRASDIQPSPMPQTFPLPPMSLSTFLQLELSSSEPSPLYIHRAANRDFPYEPSRVKLERLMNFLLLPPQLEQTLWFGALACLDAWLYTFTVLPLRFFRALYIVACSWASNLGAETKYLAAFVYLGLGRMWRRQHKGSQALKASSMREKNAGFKAKTKASASPKLSVPEDESIGRKQNVAARKGAFHHRRTKSEPSRLLPTDKADILKGLLIITSCVILMYFDASMMYHSIRGQSAIKLYVIYNALEVFDRLLAAIGQDVLECLFSKEALERRPDGRSKVLRPLWLFLLALIYNIVHAIALFYQVITLNVAVNSYSNALFTLLMSNQFVEIKSTVFKKFEKENLFQMTCADIVERFQLWLMLIIIASRNMIETNNIFGDSGGEGGYGIPIRAPNILPSSFTLMPSWAGQIMGPFFLVLGIETLVDWVKHAYITKFNVTKPNIYGRFLDVLAKDYYTHAFAEQNLTKRLGLPVIPLSCLFIRASVQTYQMFLATHLPLPLPSTATSLAEPDPSQSPATMAEMLQLPNLLRRVLGRHVPADAPAQPPILNIPYLPVALPSADTLIAVLSTGVFFALLFAVLLAAKILLGMTLLAYARRRYAGMKAREAASSTAEGRRIGGWGTVEVDEDKRRWIYDDDPEGLRKLWERDAKARDSTKESKSLAGVERYSMVAKRIW